MGTADTLDDPGRPRRFRAPGRVNLMGDHTDYNEGFVLPIAIDRWCTVASRASGRVRVRSLELGGTVEVAADGSDEPSEVEPRWGRYVGGVVRALAERGRPPAGVDAVLSSTVPPGSGLSSSAALEVGCALALGDAADWGLPPAELAAACQRGEQLATGVPSGVMDQLSSLSGRAGHALLVDCRSLEIETIPLPADLAVLVVHSGVPRTLAGTAYAERRAACETIAAELGLRSLRDASLDEVADRPLARHVVTENARVHETARALQSGDRAALGTLFSASQASLRDDFLVSTPELDVLVEELVAAGALGARLTGAGFGGCVAALVEEERVEAVADTAAEAYRSRTRREPQAFVCRAVDGAA